MRRDDRHDSTSADRASIAPLVVHALPRSRGVEWERYPAVGALDRDVRTARRRALVAGSIGACIAVLVAALFERATQPRAAPATLVGGGSSRERTSTDPSAWTDIVPAGFSPTSGTVEIDPKLGAVDLDGVRLSASSAMVTCGPHPLRIGHALRQVLVPCGGRLTVYPGGTFASE